MPAVDLESAAFSQLFDPFSFCSPLLDQINLMIRLVTTTDMFANKKKQLVFEGDFPKLGIGLGVLAVIGAGYGSMYFGMWHQQTKQGYWK